ncbi:MAG TPA: beta-ketoacyl synthase N-terminal-like domain-containing protein, partial [Polyangia bacterium]|nr:beta-ketoacyl synthase N-terminal-like domain-containing protein [Polyangia bacterium]
MAQADAAIIGIGCRLPGARTVEELWAQLVAPPPAFPHLPSDRWDARAFGPPPRARLIDDYAVDFRAFRIPPAQLTRMHRMERATLAALRDALADAGLEQPGTWGTRTQVHMAATTLGFDPAVDHLARVRLHETLAALRATGSTLSPDVLAAAERALDAAAPPISVDSLMTTAAMTAGRLANAFDLGAGHFAHDAGAASALAALAAATAALEAHECDLAVVGALSPLLAATVVEAYRQRRLLAPDDVAALHPFAAAPDAGTLLGEGALAVVLMREADARSQARRVRAVVRGGGQASIGRQSVAVGAEKALARAAKQALTGAHFDPASVDWVECQAAGFGVVDEAERRALAAVFGGARAQQPLGVATATATFGFLGAASGLLGVVTAALALERGERPGGEARAWDEPSDDARPLRLRTGALSGVRRAAVSSPGHGAAVHYVLLARADDRQPRAAPPRLPVSRWGDRRVAIVGVGAVMPGAPDARALWRGVLDGRDAIGHIPPARWDAAAFLESATASVPGAVRSTLAGLLPALAAEAARLRLPPVAARQVDGAVVLTVDACAAALEDAGYRPGAWDARRVGVIVGHLPLREREYEAERRALAARSRALVEGVLADAGVAAERAAAVGAAFAARLTQPLAPSSEETLEQLSSLGCATRVASLWDFRGGAQAVDAACASSLVALHLGVGALLRGELDAVVVAA